MAYTVAKSQQGSSKHVRWRNTFDKASEVIACDAICDCHRLGKYVGNKPCPHLLLVSLNSTDDVNNILSLRRLAPPAIIAKPDLTPEERKVEVIILLQEHWKLIESGVERQSIKPGNSSILVSGRLHGKVINSVFTSSLNLGELALKLSTLSNSQPVNNSAATTSASPPVTA